jgi:uncharacterized protein YlxP (DUF503 family)
MVVRSLKDRLRSKFNVSTAETDHQDVWQRATISVTTVASDEQYARQTLQLALDDAERTAPECVIQGNIEII